MLRYDSDFEKHVIKILQALHGFLNDVEEAISNPVPKHTKERLDMEFGHTEIEQLYQIVSSTIDILNEYSALLLDHYPLCEDRIHGTLDQDVSPFKEADERHASDKYPGADSELVKKPGTTISRRRAILRYRERQHEEKIKLGKDTDATNDVQKTEESAGGLTLSDLDLISNCDTTYSPTRFETPDQESSIPALPSEYANSQPFECPYCHFQIVAENQQDWARHIYDDILPYSCVFPGCLAWTDLCARRSHWYRQMERRHLRKNADQSDFASKCPLCRESYPVVSSKTMLLCTWSSWRYLHCRVSSIPRTLPLHPGRTCVQKLARERMLELVEKMATFTKQRTALSPSVRSTGAET